MDVYTHKTPVLFEKSQSVVKNSKNPNFWNLFYVLPSLDFLKTIPSYIMKIITPTCLSYFFYESGFFQKCVFFVQTKQRTIPFKTYNPDIATTRPLQNIL